MTPDVDDPQSAEHGPFFFDLGDWRRIFVS